MRVLVWSYTLKEGRKEESCEHTTVYFMIDYV